MKLLHTTIKTIIWCCIAITGLLLVDWFSREVIMNLPW